MFETPVHRMCSLDVNFPTEEAEPSYGQDASFMMDCRRRRTVEAKGR